MSRDLVAEKKNYETRWQSQHDIFFVQTPTVSTHLGRICRWQWTTSRHGRFIQQQGCYTDERPRLTRSEDLAKNTRSFSEMYVFHQGWVCKQDSLNLLLTTVIDWFLICNSYFESCSASPINTTSKSTNSSRIAQLFCQHFFVTNVTRLFCHESPSLAF